MTQVDVLNDIVQLAGNEIAVDDNMVFVHIRRFKSDVLQDFFQHRMEAAGADIFRFQVDAVGVFGNGVELMNASDNVLRGGLTKKRMDLAELERIMSFESIDPEKVRTEKDGFGRTVYLAPTGEFRLLSAGAGNYAMRSGRLSLVLATEGSVRFSEGSESLTIGKGECAVVPSSLEYSMNVQGRVYIAECGTLS